MFKNLEYVVQVTVSQDCSMLYI